MATQQIPQADLKFVRTTDKMMCPKCQSFDFVDTGLRANNINFISYAAKESKITQYPIYRCKKCAQLFRVSKPK